MNGKLIVGVTGSLAAGKSTVAGMLCAKGAHCLDADRISHDILRNDEGVKSKVIGLFGEDVLTGQGVDRRKLADKVFFDNGNLKKLCEVLHPLIISSIQQQAAQVEGDMIIVDAPLLIETGLKDFVDVIIVVTCGEETSINRAIDRGISREEAENILKNQMPVSEKEKFADYVINSDANLEITKEGVEKIWQNLQKVRQNLQSPGRGRPPSL